MWLFHLSLFRICLSVFGNALRYRRQLAKIRSPCVHVNVTREWNVGSSANIHVVPLVLYGRSLVPLVLYGRSLVPLVLYSSFLKMTTKSGFDLEKIPIDSHCTLHCLCLIVHSV